MRKIHLLSSLVYFSALSLSGLPVPAQETPAPVVKEKRSPSLAWEREIAAFEEADKKSFPPSDAVVFVGSSSIRLWS